MLSLLKESVQSKHAERLEQIVIALIVIEVGKDQPYRLSSKGILTGQESVDSAWGYHHSCRSIRSRLRVLPRASDRMFAFWTCVVVTYAPIVLGFSGRESFML